MKSGDEEGDGVTWTTAELLRLRQSIRENGVDDWRTLGDWSEVGCQGYDSCRCNQLQLQKIFSTGGLGADAGPAPKRIFLVEGIFLRSDQNKGGCSRTKPLIWYRSQ